MSEFVALDDPALWRNPRGGAPAARQPTVSELQDVQERAHAEAYAEGLAEGRAKAAAEAAGLRALLESLERAHAALESEICDEILTVALEVARAMLHEALPAKRELLLPVVREAMRAMPQDTRGAQVLLNPADVELLRAHIGEELRLAEWQLVEDHRIQPGGCRLVSPYCEVDATLGSRWKRVLTELGRDQAWLDG